MMNIIYATDDNYAPQCGISMLSLLENNRGEESISFYILDNGIGKVNKDKLSSQVEKYDELSKKDSRKSEEASSRKIHFVDVSDYKRRVGFDFNTAGFNPIVLARLFLVDYLPESVEKALYIDCDTIVAGALADLDAINMEKKYVAAVPELYMPPQNKANIGFEADEIYYNAGVLWVNLKKWREDNICERFMEYYKEKGGMLPYNDQDIINYCCKEYIYKLPAKYNMCGNFPYFPRKFLIKIQPGYKTDTKEEYKDMISHPAIIHYLGDERPWINGNMNYYRKYFYKYRDISAWSDMRSVRGKEWYMLCYHVLNLITSVAPWFRIGFSTYIGINIYKWFKKR